MNPFEPDKFVSPDSLSPEARAVYDANPNPIWLRMGDHYILDDDLQPLHVPFIEWSLWFERHRHERILRQQYVGVYFVSTVFLGLDHAFGQGPPVLWETMVFDHRRGGSRKWADVEPANYTRRYTSLADALAGHAIAVAYVNLLRKGPRKLKKFLRRPYGSAAGGRVVARRYRGLLAKLDVE